MPGTDYIEFGNALQYTGSNGAEMSTYANVPMISEVGGVLLLGNPVTSEVSLMFNTGDWFDRKYQAWCAGSDFPAGHITKAAALLDTDTVFDPTSLTTQVTNAAAAASSASTAAAAATSAAAGKLGKADLVSISVPILLLGGFADRAITWNRPFSNTSYDLSYAMDASTIGRIVPTVVAGTKTTTGVTIRVTASLLAVSVLGVVHVLGIGA